MGTAAPAAVRWNRAMKMNMGGLIWSVDAERDRHSGHNYRLVKQLGEGTYATVYLAQHHKSGQKVAIKVIHKSGVSVEDMRRVRREIKVLGAIRHPHITQVYRTHEDGNRLYMVLEFADGGELYDHVASKQLLTSDEARTYMRHVVSAVYYCHKRDIVHRDLKLENILLDRRLNVKLSDFGLCNFYSYSSLLTTYCGSPLYASPEIIAGRPYVGPEIDCWSLGVLLFSLVYGSMPFGHADFGKLKRQITTGDFFIPDYLSDAHELICRCLTVDIRHRATIDEIAHHPWLNESYTHTCYCDAALQLGQCSCLLSVHRGLEGRFMGALTLSGRGSTQPPQLFTKTERRRKQPYNGVLFHKALSVDESCSTGPLDEDLAAADCSMAKSLSALACLPRRLLGEDRLPMSSPELASHLDSPRCTSTPRPRSRLVLRPRALSDSCLPLLAAAGSTGTSSPYSSTSDSSCSVDLDVASAFLRHDGEFSLNTTPSGDLSPRSYISWESAPPLEDPPMPPVPPRTDIPVLILDDDVSPISTSRLTLRRVSADEVVTSTRYTTARNGDEVATAVQYTTVRNGDELASSTRFVTARTGEEFATSTSFVTARKASAPGSSSITDTTRNGVKLLNEEGQVKIPLHIIHDPVEVVTTSSATPVVLSSAPTPVVPTTTPAVPAAPVAMARRDLDGAVTLSLRPSDLLTPLRGCDSPYDNLLASSLGSYDNCSTPPSDDSRDSDDEDYATPDLIPSSRTSGATTSEQLTSIFSPDTLLGPDSGFAEAS